MESFDELIYPRAKTVGGATEVTLVTPIREGRIPGEYRTYRARLEAVLDDVQQREAAGRSTPVSFIRQIHFARWVVFDPPGGGRPLLVFTSNFDGEMKHYFRNFSLQLTRDINRVWENCENYPGAHDFDGLWKYVKQHQVETRTFYDAYRRLSMPQILQTEGLKTRFDAAIAALGPLLLHPPATPDPLFKALYKLLGEAQTGTTPARVAQQLRRKLHRELQSARTAAAAAPAAPPPPLALDDIQANIVTSPPWMSAGYHFLTITDAAAFRAALLKLLGPGDGAAPRLTTAGDVARSKKDHSLRQAFNLAFTWNGLARLGVAGEHLGTLPLPFREGMAARAAILGDSGRSAPESWEAPYGGSEVHALVAAHSLDGDAEAAWQALVAAAGGTGGALPGTRQLHVERGNRMVRREDGHRYTVEHFGFRDGIGQPEIAGAADGRCGANVVAAGEFLLGYDDADGNDQVALKTVGEKVRALCRNGTYMVFRKLEQDVRAFRAFLRENADGEKEQEKLAARLFGRWPNGSPLAIYPKEPGPTAGRDVDEEDVPQLNGFTYGKDPAGRRCPFASHVRRVNPRDDLDPAEVQRHRILRRGITYNEGGRKGMLFVAFNARIDTQFEFLQSEWCNKGDFLGRCTEERDPIVGDGPGGCSFAAIPAPLVPLQRKRPFVTVRGGEYFLMPGLAALGAVLRGEFDGAPPADFEPDALSATKASGVARSVQEAQAIPGDLFDPVATAVHLDAAPLLDRRDILTKTIDWPDHSQEIAYVACHDQVMRIFADEQHFTSAHNARKIVGLLGGAARDPRLAPLLEPPHGEERKRILGSALLGMPSSDPEKQARLAILKALVQPTDIRDIVEPSAAATMQEILERQRGGFLDVGKDVATAVPIARVFRYFGLPQPTTISTAHRALYFRRESFEDVVAMGWYREFPKYRKAEIPLREMAALVRAVAVYLLIDAYETRDTLTAAKLAIGALIDHAVTGLNQAMQNPQALAGTLLGRLYAHATQQPDPVTAYLRAAMILAELTVGSIDTTAKGIVNTIDCLLNHPAALEAARTAVKGGDDRSLDRIIYEALRLQPVAPFLIRECPDGAEIDGAEIEGGRAPLRFAPGSRVFLLLGAAMRDRGGDPGMPADLSGFVLDPGHDARLDPLRHLVFGTPPHDCYGRFMALAEIRQVLKALLAKPNLRRAAGPAGVKREEFRFPVSLGVRFDA